MKYKVGDRVKIKSLDWYNENKDEYGYVRCVDSLFTPEHSKYCGCEFTISHITEFQIPSYVMENNGHEWTDEMIEGLVEEESKSTDDINRESKITYAMDLIPYDSPNYLDEFRAIAESYVKAEDNKYFQEYMNSLCKEHDDMIEECMKDGTIVDYVKESNDRYRIVIDPRFDIEVDEGNIMLFVEKRSIQRLMRSAKRFLDLKVL